MKNTGLKEMHPDIAESAAVHIKRLADCTGEPASDIFEKLIAANSITDQDASEMSQYFSYDDD